mgnify:CR=1 FL=1
MGTHVRQVCEAPHGGWTALAALLPHLERAHERRGGMLCNVEHGPAMINLAEAEFQAISRHQRYEGPKVQRSEGTNVRRERHGEGLRRAFTLSPSSLVTAAAAFMLYRDEGG